MSKPDNTPKATISFSASAMVPTRHGDWEMSTFHDAQGDEHVCLTHGDVSDGEDILCRFHSACMTGEIFGSSRCDCGEQLEAAFHRIQQAGRGVIVYLAQEGRGIGLTNKLRAYDVQNRGYDTVDANRALGLPDDLRNYDGANAILKLIGVKSVRLMTNNPDKLRSVRSAGLLSEREPHLQPVGNLAQRYVRTKQHRMGHLNEGNADTRPLFLTEFNSLLSAS